MANENKALNKSKNVLDKARAAKKDEFYTRLEDIEHVGVYNKLCK